MTTEDKCTAWQCQSCDKNLGSVEQSAEAVRIVLDNGRALGKEGEIRSMLVTHRCTKCRTINTLVVGPCHPVWLSFLKTYMCVHIEL